MLLQKKPYTGFWEQSGDGPVNSLELKSGAFSVQRLAPGLCLAFVLTPRPRAAQEFSPFLRPMFDLNRQCGSSEEGGRMMAGVYGEVSAECARDSLGMNVALCVCA